MVKTIFEAENISHILVEENTFRICLDDQCLLFAVIENKLVRMTEFEFFKYNRRSEEKA